APFARVNAQQKSMGSLFFPFVRANAQHLHSNLGIVRLPLQLTLFLRSIIQLNMPINTQVPRLKALNT
ncbi:MAG: hypothetical protein PHV75_08030, partial [Victivallaceae bacterium]|nr:hypothetical protein [Victivallaceae bacterium]MDD4318450.1 hypothetical protein [Victivallaceae bacterium]MDD5663948.1 hypothetical protein [Victivallaceae bacterium]